MKLLALEASTPALSVALAETAAPARARSFFEIAPRGHGQRLIPVARSLLADNGWAWTDLDGLAFACGPGAFTGLRVAAGLVQGLATGLRVDVVPVDTLRALAARCAAATDARRVQVVQDARMGEIYTGVYAVESAGSVRVVSGPRVVAPAALAIDTRADARAGAGWPLVAAAQHRLGFDVAVESPHAEDVARLGLADFAAGQGRPAAEALPVYVRDDVVRGPAQRHADR